VSQIYIFTSLINSSYKDAIPEGSLKVDLNVAPSFKVHCCVSVPPSHEKTSFLKGSKTLIF